MDGDGKAELSVGPAALESLGQVAIDSDELTGFLEINQQQPLFHQERRLVGLWIGAVIARDDHQRGLKISDGEEIRKFLVTISRLTKRKLVNPSSVMKAEGVRMRTAISLLLNKGLRQEVGRLSEEINFGEIESSSEVQERAIGVLRGLVLTLCDGEVLVRKHNADHLRADEKIILERIRARRS